jgi:integrase
MARAMNLLNTLKVDRTKKPGMYADGGNLYLQVVATANESLSKSWIFRYVSPVEVYPPGHKRAGRGRVRDMGLGPAADFSLAEARQMAQDARKKVHGGIDPLAAKTAEQAEKRAAVAKYMTFEQCARAYIEAHSVAWSNDKHRRQWGSTIETYAKPAIGSLPVQAIDTALVLKVIQPIWNEKPETASRLRGRIESILDWATTSGYRKGDNPARWRGHLENLLAAKAKVRKVRHHPALPYKDIPAFMAELRARDSLSARALEFTILTAARTGESVMAKRHDEIDHEERAWDVPADRMKAKKPHRVPLTGRALEIIQDLPEVEGNPYLFPGGKPGKSLSNMAMAELLKGMGWKDKNGETIVPHGFRSTFRDWAAERTGHPGDVVEAALAHTIDNKVEAAYRRGDLFEKRRRLMDDWAAYCASPPAEETGAVVPMKRRAAR